MTATARFLRLTVVPLLLVVPGACHRDDVAEVVIGDRPETVIFDVASGDGSTSNYPRDFGTTCEANTDCLSGFCVEGPDASVCTMNCIEDCPEGWQCRGIVSGSSDVAFVCVPGGGTDPGDVADGDVAIGADVSAPIDGNNSEITDPMPEGELCGVPLGPANEVVFREEPDLDLPDCVVGCPHAAADYATIIDLRRDPYTAVGGIIDFGEHTYEGMAGPDIDIVSIIAPPRTMLEFAIQREDGGSIIDPLIYVTDGFAIRTYNRDLSNSNDCARSTIAFPWLQDLAIYVVIEHTVNADVWDPSGYVPGSWAGGPGYRWLLRIRARPFEFVDLGSVTQSGATLAARGEILEKPGITRYFRFRAPGDAAVRVDLTEAGGTPASFVPMLAGMKTMLGALEWQFMNHDGDDDGRVQLQRSAFRPCVPAAECNGDDCNGPRCTSELVEYVFAVSDWGGEGGPAFRFDLDVRMD